MLPQYRTYISFVSFVWGAGNSDYVIRFFQSETHLATKM